MRFKIDCASLIVGRKFTVLALFYFVFEGNFQVQAPWGLIFGGAISRWVFCVASLWGLYLEGLIHGGAYFRNFTVTLLKMRPSGTPPLTSYKEGSRLPEDPSRPRQSNAVTMLYPDL